MSLKQAFLDASQEDVKPITVEGFPAVFTKVLSAERLDQLSDLNTAAKDDANAKGVGSVIWILGCVCDQNGELLFDITSKEDCDTLRQNCSMRLLREVTNQVLEANGIGDDAVETAKNE